MWILGFLSSNLNVIWCQLMGGCMWAVDDLNRMVAGLDGGALAQLMQAPDAPAFAGNLTQKYRPGTVWEYNTENFVLLLYSIR
jgi:hypothetical protein